MADIEVVIKIPEDDYKRIVKYGMTVFGSDEDIDLLERALENGIVLPKGHGRIVDIDNAVKDLESVNESFCTFCARGYGARVDYIGEVLIEADKEETDADSN